MTARSVHCTSEELHTLLDGRLSDADRAELAGHLQECTRCMAAYRGIQHLDRGLRALPVVATSAEFTGNVMEKVLPSGNLSLAFRIVENLAYLFAVVIVTGIITVVFIATGVIDSGQVSEGQGAVNAYTSAAGTWLSQALLGVAQWLERYLPAKTAVNIMLVGIGVLAGLGLLDRLLYRRFAHRTR
jgi:anti-sigma factor RsiW